MRFLRERPQCKSAPRQDRAARSKIWPNFGLAILRSDESPGYWTNNKAIAVFQLMTQGYSHDHADKLGIMLFGAGRLLYPDYLAIQYEHPAIGWTSSSVAHNLMVVDEQDTRRPGCALFEQSKNPPIRYEFTPEVKFLATSTAELFDGVDQTRTLLLTAEYLLDVFQASSKVKHTYDYLLHSFGKPQPADVGAFRPASGLARYTAMEKHRLLQTDGPWSLDFVIRDDQAPVAAVRVSMAAEPGTAVWTGEWGEQYARLVKDRTKREPDRLGMCVVRRQGVRETVYAATHEPYAADQTPAVTAITTLAIHSDAVVVRVRAKDFTDYAAVSFGPQEGRPEQVLAAGDGQAFAFRNYGYLRIGKDGQATARGGWTGFRIPVEAARLVVNGKPATVTRQGNMLVYGQVPSPKPAASEPLVEPPFETRLSSPVVRLGPETPRKTTLCVKNTLKEPVSGVIELDLPAGVSCEPARPAFGPVAPGAEAAVAATLTADAKAAAGETSVPYRFVYETGGKKITTLSLPLRIAVGPSLGRVYPPGDRPYCHVNAPRYSLKLDMWHGMPRFLADDDGVVRLQGSPLFTFGDGKEPLLFEHTSVASVWPGASVAQDGTPAGLTAAVANQCRYNVKCVADRVIVSMDRDHTLFPRAHFTVPGKWMCPNGAPRWKRVVAVDAAGKEFEAQSGAKVRTIAAELEFPGAGWNLAFEFRPAQEVTFAPTGLEFSIGSLTEDNWSVGFCRPGQLDAWRKKAGASVPPEESNASSNKKL